MVCPLSLLNINNNGKMAFWLNLAIATKYNGSSIRIQHTQTITNHKIKGPNSKKKESKWKWPTSGQREKKHRWRDLKLVVPYYRAFNLCLLNVFTGQTKCTHTTFLIWMNSLNEPTNEKILRIQTTCTHFFFF